MFVWNHIFLTQKRIKSDSMFTIADIVSIGGVGTICWGKVTARDENRIVGRLGARCCDQMFIESLSFHRDLVEGKDCDEHAQNN